VLSLLSFPFVVPALPLVVVSVSALPSPVFAVPALPPPVSAVPCAELSSLQFPLLDPALFVPFPAFLVPSLLPFPGAGPVGCDLFSFCTFAPLFPILFRAYHESSPGILLGQDRLLLVESVSDHVGVFLPPVREGADMYPPIAHGAGNDPPILDGVATYRPTLIAWTHVVVCSLRAGMLISMGEDAVAVEIEAEIESQL
jgi:hypothetical protein